MTWDYPNISNPENYLKEFSKKLSFCHRHKFGITTKVAARGVLVWLWVDYWNRPRAELSKKLGINTITLRDSKQAIEKARAESTRILEVTSEIRDSFLM